MHYSGVFFSAGIVGLSFSQTWSEFLCGCIASAIGQGLSLSVVMIVLTDAFGVARLHRVMGVLSFLTGLPLFLTPEIAGDFFALVWKEKCNFSGLITHYYNLQITFRVFGVGAFLSAIGYFVVALTMKKRLSRYAVYHRREAKNCDNLLTKKDVEVQES